jgi:hypothetical protein
MPPVTSTVLPACNCQVGFSGKVCEVAPKDPCSPLADGSPYCWNTGVCASAIGTATAYAPCKCQAGFTGLRCEVAPAPVCQPDFCLNRGVCLVGTTGAFSCLCPTGFKGTTCSDSATASDMCAVQPDGTTYCVNKGQCSPPAPGVTGGVPTCKCGAEFSGRRCEMSAAPVPTCTPADCSNHGTCAGSLTGFTTCTCGKGFFGPICADTCASAADCSNHGVCGSAAGGFRVCQCSKGFLGAACADVDKTMTCTVADTCSMQGACVVGDAGVKGCACFIGFSGAQCDTFSSTCFDRVRNGDELYVDCGGSCANCGCHITETCSGHGLCSVDAKGVKSCTCTAEFAGPVCADAKPVAATCSDRVRNGDEVSTDCGGSCVVACVVPCVAASW